MRVADGGGGDKRVEVGMQIQHHKGQLGMECLLFHAIKR